MFEGRPWTRHRKGLGLDGKCVCLRCGVELPYTIPVEQIVCSKEDRLFLGDIEGAVDCK